jgi:hypothetical protein
MKVKQALFKPIVIALQQSVYMESNAFASVLNVIISIDAYKMLKIIF